MEFALMGTIFFIPISIKCAIDHQREVRSKRHLIVSKFITLNTISLFMTFYFGVLLSSISSGILSNERILGTIILLFLSTLCTILIFINSAQIVVFKDYLLFQGDRILKSEIRRIEVKEFYFLNRVNIYHNGNVEIIFLPKRLTSKLMKSIYK